MWSRQNRGNNKSTCHIQSERNSLWALQGGTYVQVMRVIIQASSSRNWFAQTLWSASTSRQLASSWFGVQTSHDICRVSAHTPWYEVRTEHINVQSTDDWCCTKQLPRDDSYRRADREWSFRILSSDIVGDGCVQNINEETHWKISNASSLTPLLFCSIIIISWQHISCLYTRFYNGLMQSKESTKSTIATPMHAWRVLTLILKGRHGWKWSSRRC